MLKKIARTPIRRTGTYLKYGFIIMEHEYYCCPSCKKTLNAGPMYQPKYCPECGQKVTFKNIEWIADKKLGYSRTTERGSSYAPIKN